MNYKIGITFAALVAATAIISQNLPGQAQEEGCPILQTAIAKAMNQPRLHRGANSGIVSSDGKFLPSTSDIKHLVAIGQNLFVFDAKTSGNGKTEFRLGTSHGHFEDINANYPCTVGPTETLAGKPAQTIVQEDPGLIGSDKTAAKVWIDQASGLPVRTVTMANDIDVQMNASADGKVNITSKPTGKKTFGKLAYLYGDIVTEPKTDSKTGLAQTSAAETEALNALLK